MIGTTSTTGKKKKKGKKRKKSSTPQTPFEHLLYILEQTSPSTR